MSDPITQFTEEMATDSGAEPVRDLVTSRVDDVAWYDFSRYEYLLVPDVLTQPDPADAFASTPPAVVELVEADVPTGDLTVFTTQLAGAVAAHCLDISQIRVEVVFKMSLASLGFDRSVAAALIDQALQLSGELPRLLEVFWALSPSDRLAMLNEIVDRLPPDPVSGQRTWSEIADLISLGQGGDPAFWLGRLVLRWSEIADALEEAYGGAGAAPDGEEPPAETPQYGHPFDLFDPNGPHANVGLRFIHRQEWRPLGTQPGDIVRTLPLGPAETKKVSTKIVRRTKVARTTEQMKSVETSTETADTSKDSAEVANEASKTFGWHAEAEANGRWGWGSAKVSGGLEGESASKSRETSSHLSESMQKTANRIRTDSKVVVSTEEETQFEATSASEIRNPNDEIAVTYVYQKLQTQYSVFTSLVDVTPVVMVAEPVPLPAQVTAEWVKRHDWILARALLDDSFRETLGALSQTAPPAAAGTAVDDAKGVLDDAVASLDALAKSASTSLSLRDIDVTQEAQRGYRDALGAEAERSRQRTLRATQEERLLQHFRDNVLHYCRAIWSQEDPEQRILRYRRLGIVVPTQFEYEGGVALADLLEAIAAGGGLRPEIFGKFIAPDPAGLVPVADVIERSVPIGFVGNYAVFRIKPEYLRSETFQPLQILLSPYLEPVPGGAADERRVVDPELLALRDKYEGVDVSAEVAGRATRLDMIDTVPELRLRYQLARELDGADEDGGGAVAELLDDDAAFEAAYPDYLFRTSRTQKIVLDTNNLVVDVRPGRGSVMEAFKRAHRLLDVRRAELENVRREKLIDNGRYGDPEIEKVTVVTGDGLKGLVNVAGLDEVA